MKKLVMVLASLMLASALAFGADFYVSKNTGKNSNAGTKDAPFKNLQKALDVAAAGDKIYVAAGNYFGLMDKGYLEMKQPVHIYGGYTTDFGSRDVLKNKTLVMPPASANGTSNSQALLSFKLPNECKYTDIVIDGLIFDKGDSNAYHVTEGKPAGVDTGMLLLPPATGPSKIPTSYNPIIMGSTWNGNVLFQNCTFNNGPQSAIQITHKEGTVKIFNNVFTANAIAAITVMSGNVKPGKVLCIVERNTIFFNWSRTKANEDMGYGVRCMSGVDMTIVHNLIGLSSFSGIDRTRVDSNKSNEAARVIAIESNTFFMNKKADLCMPSGGGLYLSIFVDMIEDAEGIASAVDNDELKDTASLKKVLNKAYLEGFVNAAYKEKTDYDPNSKANQFNRALGLNQVGSIKTQVSMFANRYPLDDALKLFGAVPRIGAQAITN